MTELEQFYDKVMEKPLQVYNVFKEFFTEDRVDLQGFHTLEEVKRHFKNTLVTDIDVVRNYMSERTGDILVYFPHVKITNEFDKSVDITKLFAKVTISIMGTIVGRFTLNRAEYTLLHLQNNYMHSHISQIPFGHFTDFQLPCTGTGPINSTICNLARDFDLDIWNLFCLELSKYVEVESITGTPYHRLEQLVAGGPSHFLTTLNTFGGSFNIERFNFDDVLLMEFITYLLKSKVLKFAYYNKQYTIGMSVEEAIIKISNCFIEWANNKYKLCAYFPTIDELKSNEVLITCKLNNGKLVVSRNRNSNTLDYRQYEGAPICMFKGNQIRLHILGVTNSENENFITILNKVIIDYILVKIINVLNFKYGEQSENSSGEEKCYL